MYSVERVDVDAHLTGGKKCRHDTLVITGPVRMEATDIETV